MTFNQFKKEVEKLAKDRTCLAKQEFWVFPKLQHSPTKETTYYASVFTPVEGDMDRIIGVKDALPEGAVEKLREALKEANAL